VLTIPAKAVDHDRARDLGRNDGGHDAPPVSACC